MIAGLIAIPASGRLHFARRDLSSTALFRTTANSPS
jgi:hypothetical protein